MHDSKERSSRDDSRSPDEPAGEEIDDRASDQTEPREIGGRREGLDPTRYGDWEKNGRCIDF